MATITDKVDAMLTRLKDQDEKRHDPEHDLPHIHENDREDGRSRRVHGAAGTYETSELRAEIEALATIVRELAAELGYDKRLTIAGAAKMYDAGEGRQVTIPEGDFEPDPRD